MYLKGIKQSREGPFLIQEKGAGGDGRSVFVPRRRPESFSAWALHLEAKIGNAPRPLYHQSRSANAQSRNPPSQRRVWMGEL